MDDWTETEVSFTETEASFTDTEVSFTGIEVSTSLGLSAHTLLKHLETLSKYFPISKSVGALKVLAAFKMLSNQKTRAKLRYFQSYAEAIYFDPFFQMKIPKKKKKRRRRDLQKSPKIQHI